MAQHIQRHQNSANTTFTPPLWVELKVRRPRAVGHMSKFQVSNFFYRVISSISFCYRLISSISSCYRVISSISFCYRLISAISSCYRVISSISSRHRVISSIFIPLYTSRPFRVRAKLYNYGSLSFSSLVLNLSSFLQQIVTH